MTVHQRAQMPWQRYTTWRDWCVLGVIVACLVSTHWVTVNLTPSVPKGLYRYVTSATPIQRGALVVVPAVSFGRPWYARWVRLLKPVAGIPGDTACVEVTGLQMRYPVHEGLALKVVAVPRMRYSVSNMELALEVVVDYGPVYQEHHGEPLPVAWGCHVVQDGEIFVASHEPRSLDSRYFGPVSLAQAHRVVPVWTWQ
jgi:type IV secretory pathway protease TraF